MNSTLIENEDYYFNENGWLVLTDSFLKRRGYCCGNGCVHCPYDYENVKDINKKRELNEKRKTNTSR